VGIPTTNQLSIKIALTFDGVKPHLSDAFWKAPIRTEARMALVRDTEEDLVESGRFGNGSSGVAPKTDRNAWEMGMFPLYMKWLSFMINVW